MALIKCRECGKDVSSKAVACPGCGAPPSPRAKQQQVSPLVSLIIITVVIGVVVSMCTSSVNKEAGCAKDDLQCLGDKAVIAAGVYCKDPIERLAKHSVRWTDTMLEKKFSHIRWLDKSTGRLTQIGDKAEFQNGFGAFTPVTYECDLDADGKTVLDVRVREGRLR